MARLLIAIAVVFGAAAWQFVAAAGAAGWGPAVQLSGSGGLTSYAQVALDARGDATAAWMEVPGANSFYYGARTSTRLVAGSGWGSSTVLSPPGVEASFPQIATDPAGASVIVWEQGGEYLNSAPGPRYPPWVESSFRSSPASAWQQPLQVTPVGVEADQVRVGIDAHGNGVASWVQTTRQRCTQIESATRAAKSGRWSRPVQLAGDCRHMLVWPRLAVSSRGDAVLTWMTLVGGSLLGPEGTSATVQAAIKHAGRGWSRPVRLGTAWDPPYQSSASFEFPAAKVALDQVGDAIVVWQGNGHGATFPEADIRLASARRWERPARIANVTALLPAVAVDASGDATVVWQDDLNGAVRAASRSLYGRRWSAPRTLFAASPYRADPQISIDGHGDAIAIADIHGVQAANRRGPHGAWQHAVRLGAGGVPQVALDPRGNAIAVWQRPIGHSIVIEAARYNR